MIKSKKQMFIVIGAFALVMLLGTVTYAFFNYTRTGGQNIVNTGKIKFSSTQTTDPVVVSNLFPLTQAPTIATTYAAETTFARVKVHVEGETTWADGLDYTVKAVQKDLTVGSSSDPLPLRVNVYALASTATGSETGDTFTADMTGGVLPAASTEANTQLAHGHIAGTDTAATFTGRRYQRDIIVDAYILSSDIAITDTEGESAAWIGDRTTVYTADEWNALSTAGGAKFKILVESNESALSNQSANPVVPTIATCPNCVYMFDAVTEDGIYATSNTFDGIPGVLQDSDYTNNYLDLVSTGKNIFLGVIVNNTTHQIDNAYVCGIKGEYPNNGAVFCIQSSVDGSKYSDNVSLLQGENLWNNQCSYNNESDGIECDGSTYASTYSDGTVYVIDGEHNCGIEFGYMYCS